MDTTFKHKCSGCNKIITLDEFLNDPRVRVIGMAYKRNGYSKAYFFFHHDTSDCGTTILIDAEKLASMASNLDFYANPNLCECGKEFGLKIEDLESCRSGCEITPYKSMLQIMLRNKLAKAS